MSNPDDTGKANGVIGFIQSTIERFGIPTALMIAVLWWANATIIWERERMLPAIEKNTAALERASEVNIRIENALERVSNKIQ